MSETEISLYAFESKSFKELKESDLNPYIEEIKFKSQTILKRFKKGEAVISETSNLDFEEIQSLTLQNTALNLKGLSLGKIKEKQIASFILLYTDLKMNYKKISSVTLKTLLYILYEKVNLGCDYIILTPKELIENLQLSKNNSYDVFVELVNNKILYKRTDSVWWINPNYFYAGNRLKIIRK